MNKNNNLRSSAAKRRLRESLAGLAFVSPFIIGFVLFILSPLVMYVVMSFSKLTLNDEGAMVFNNMGFKNYIPLGYMLQGRLDYYEKDIAAFRKQVE